MAFVDNLIYESHFCIFSLKKFGYATLSLYMMSHNLRRYVYDIVA